MTTQNKSGDRQIVAHQSLKREKEKKIEKVSVFYLQESW